VKVRRGGQRGFKSSDKVFGWHGVSSVVVGTAFHDTKPRAK